ncbi:MAG: response regulator [Lachnospiraceae bacterium]|nr:response regulator [Lachnospiraceae bacterium]MBP3610875.1 response regulator [Lachnospiraceae bacterium]
MKKVLLVGELNMTVSSVNQYLSNRFQTQICMNTYELVKGMEKVFKPDLVIVCLVGSETLDSRILPFLGEKNKPILIIGTKEECEGYQKFKEENQCDFAYRPITLQALLKKCMTMLKLEEEVQDESPAAEQPSKEKKHVLAVDDSGILLRSVKKMLEGQYEVTVATSGMMAITQAKKKRPDLILLDYEMPEWDGKRTLEEIRKDEELKAIPVLFLTAVADKAHITAVLGLNPCGYLLKPIEQQKLIDTVEKALSGEI